MNNNMRIKRIEVRNFGTWTGASAHVFDLNRAGAVIAGENGAGKSTIMDAIVTLFQYGNKNTFNAAAVKDGKSSRNIADYYKGTHGNTEDEGKNQAIVLRSFGDESTTMMLLATFENGAGAVLTVAKSLFITLSGEHKWRFFTSSKDLNINTHFSEYVTGRELTTRANRFGFDIHDSLTSYWGAVAEGLGLTNAEHAKRAFNTLILTMSVPEMTSVTNFVREHILPKYNLLEDADSYIQILNNNGAIQEEIRKTKRRVAKLEEVVEIIDTLEGQISRHKTATMNQSQINAVKQYVVLHNLRHGLSSKARSLRDAEKRITEINGRKPVLNDALDEVRRARNEGGTDGIERLRKDLVRAEEISISKQEKLLQLLLSASKFTNPGNVSDNLSWERLKKTAHQVKETTSSGLDENERFLNEVNNDIRKAEEGLNILRAEHDSLVNNKSGVDRDLIQDRNFIASKLGIRPEDIPFFAEVVQVKASESTVWENALNKLLRGVSTTILVPQGHYAKAKSVLRQVNGRSFIRLQEVWEDELGMADGSGLTDLSPQSAAHLFDVKDDTPFGRYVEKTLAKQADHTCISDDDLHVAHKRAIAPSGVIISSQSRAEKDNRSFRNVLGWSMEGKIEIVKSQIDLAISKLSDLNEKRAQAMGGVKVMKDKHTAAELFILTSDGDWSAIDPTAQIAAVDQIRQTLSSLEEKEELSGLAEKERKLREEISTLDDEKNRLTRAIGQADTMINTFKEGMSDAAKQLSFLREDGLVMSISDYKSIRKLIREAMKDTGSKGRGLLISQNQGDITTLFRTVTGSVINSIATLNKEIEKTERLLNNKASEYGKIFEADNTNLFFSLHGADRVAHDKRQTWRDLLVFAKDRDLRAAEEKAKQLGRKTLYSALLSVQSAIKAYEGEVRALASGINYAMAGNVYNPRSGSYASITLTNAKDPYHQDLDKLLINALVSDEKTDIEFYDDAAKISDYIKDDGTKTQSDRRARLSNLANRYESSVKERVRQDDGIERQLRNITGAGALSGGEKERLNVFLLSAALDTAFRSKTRPELSLKAFIVDEAFSKSSDESTRAALEVINSFGHQVIVATPMAKLLPFEDVSESVFLVSRPQNANSVKQVIKMRTLVDDIKGELSDAA